MRRNGNYMTNKNRNKGISIVLFVLLAISLLLYLNSMSSTNEEYSAVVQQFKEQKVEMFTLNLGSGKMNYRLVGDPGNVYTRNYTVPDVEIFIFDISPYIEEYNENHPDNPMQYDYTPASNIWAIVGSVLPMLLLVGLALFMYINMSKQGGNISSIGKARVRDGHENGRKATFDDVAGADEEKAELAEIVDYLKNPKDFNSLGAKIPTGVLLVGPPGTGKTLLARAVAGEAGVPFFSLSGSDFVELYVGIGASRVRDLFDKAKKSRPSIIFIDEIDAVGRRRGAGLGGGHDEREQTLNQLLVEMDGFATNEGVIVMAATNRSDILDPALLRPGRFDREIYVGYPDAKGREAILKVHAKNKPIAPDVDLSVIAKTTIGFTGADLENLINEAALLAARAKRKAITEVDIEEASMKVIAGPEKKSRVVTERERRLTAYHESGHAIATYFAQPEKPVHQISIIPRGMAGGYTLSLPGEDANYETKNEMLNEITTLLGGRVAEHLILDDISTGASNDLERATNIARSMVTKYGFSDKLGPIVYGNSHDEVFLGRDFTQSRNYSEKVADEIDGEIKDIVNGAYSRCENILNEHIDKLHTVAKELLDKEKIDGETFKRLMEQSPETEEDTEEQQISE